MSCVGLHRGGSDVGGAAGVPLIRCNFAPSLLSSRPCVVGRIRQLAIASIFHLFRSRKARDEIDLPSKFTVIHSIDLNLLATYAFVS